MAFKGPKGQLTHLFNQETVYRAVCLLLDEKLCKWQYKESIETINAVIEGANKTQRVSINWPLQIDPENNQDEPLGSCTCEQPKPCVHLAALLIESKSRLHQLPPFTQQLQANQNIAETFANWMNKQTFDPYPNMARHRLIYLLDYDEAVQKFSIALHKAYISTEGRYSLKSELDSGFLQKISLPKFVSIEDQKILHLLQRNGVHKQHKFYLESQRDSTVFKEILLSNHCFWKACYRTPLEFDQDVNLVNRQAKRIIDNYFLSVTENNVVTKSPQSSNPVTVKINHTTLIPHLHISSREVEVKSADSHYFEIDSAQVSFISNEKEFNFADLSNGTVFPDGHLLNKMVGFLRQIENLDSVYAHFEKTVVQNFHLNDRFLTHDFRAYAYLLRGLQKDGWKISINDNYRMNRQQVNDWYADLSQDKDNWFDLELGVKIDGKPINLLPYLVKAIGTGKWQSQNQQDLTIKLTDGSNIDLSHKSIKTIFSTLSELYDTQSLNQNKQLKLSGSQLTRINQLQCALTEQNNSIEIQGDEWLQQKAQQLAQNKGLEVIDTPKNLKVEMRDYQKLGLSWLQFLSQHHLGGILADDMGLGKTLQVLAHILTEKNSKRLATPCLIVVPTTLLSNWQTEINKFTPSLSSLLLVGPKRDKLYQQVNSYDIVITSYGIMTRDVKKLAECAFHMFILDEAQTIKNAKTRTAQAASAIPAQLRLCLSGTPIENHLGELWSLFNFLMPGFLGHQKQFEQVYQVPIERLKDPERQTDLSARVSPFMLRRTKSEVAKELPEKTEITQLIELNESQANVYETIRMTMSNEIQKAFEKTNQSSANKIIIGNALLRLRQVCCHPALLNLEALDNTAESAKLNWLTTVLPNMVEEGRRILLFSSFTSMLTIIKDHLDTMQIDSITLTGKTPANKRGALIDRFQTGNVPVFLISLKAGGAGINLTAADTVIHFDPWWNPAAESQASDRAHRIGQDKKVFVYKLITKGTVEQRIQKLQKHKHALAQSIFDGQGNISSVLNDTQWQSFLKPIDTLEN